MAGMDSENVQLGIYDTASGSVTYVTADEFGYDRYLTNITWAPDASKIYIQVLDRSQKHMKLNSYDPANGEKIGTILTEDNEKYVEPFDPLYFVKGTDMFLYRTANRDGFRNL
jgi:dipeptidyl-peptidase-4